jgi:hypothetical protein
MSARTGGVGVLSLACVLAGTAFAQKADEKPAKKVSLYNIGLHAGKVLKAEPEGKTLKLRVYGQTLVPVYTPGKGG